MIDNMIKLFDLSQAFHIKREANKNKNSENILCNIRPKSNNILKRKAKQNIDEPWMYLYSSQSIKSTRNYKSKLNQISKNFETSIPRHEEQKSKLTIHESIKHSIQLKGKDCNSNTKLDCPPGLDHVNSSAILKQNNSKHNEVLKKIAKKYDKKIISTFKRYRDLKAEPK